MQTRLYINNELCRDLSQLQDQIRNLSYGSETFSDILEYAMCGDMSVWLREHGHEELGDKIESIDQAIGDTEFLALLTNILLGEATSLKKTNYLSCFFCDINVFQKNYKEIEVQLSVTPTAFVNENYEIKVSCGWGTKARVFNPSQYEVRTIKKETIAFHKHIEKELATNSGDIRSPQSNVVSGTRQIHEILEMIDSPRLIANIISQIGRLKQADEKNDP